MKNYLFTLLMILIIVGLFAQAPADDIQGKLYFDDGQGGYIQAGAGFKITVKLYYGETILETEDVYTDINGLYSHNFDPLLDGNYVSSRFSSTIITEPFDGIVRIDLYIDEEQPEPDPEPNND